MRDDILRRFGRRLRFGMVGGGTDSLIGETHRYASRIDGRYDLVAGCLSVGVIRRPDERPARHAGEAEFTRAASERA